MKDWKNMWLGIGLMILGAFLLAVQFDIIVVGWKSLWPLIILIPGLLFELGFLFERDIPGILVPGGILTVTGLNFLVCSNFGWWLMKYLWPLFPLAVAFGLFQLYLFDGRDRDLLIPVAILGSVSAVAFFCIMATFVVGKIIPFAIIALGIFLYVRGRQTDRSY
jgi:hypothetical protein